MNPIYKSFCGLRISKCFVFLIFLFFLQQKAFTQPDTIRYTGSSSFCQGGSLILTANPTGSTYVWQLNGTTVSTASSYTVNQSGTVTVTVNGNLYSALNIVVNPRPTVTFTNNNNGACSGTITNFTSNPIGGTAPYTYLWAFGDGSTSSQQNPSQSLTALGCSGTASLTNNLTVKDVNGCTGMASGNISVIRAPDVQLADSNVFSPFRNCDNHPTAANPTYRLKVLNISPGAGCIASYTLDWGDGGGPQPVTAASFPLVHIYTQLGAFNLVITATGTNGCTSSKTYIVANQNNPAGGIGTLGATTGLCAPASIPFTIDNWQGNSPGTTYFFDFGDGTSFTLAHPLNSNYTTDTVNHVFAISSCPNPTFTVTLKAINACDVTPYTASNIQVRIKPTARFTSAAGICAGQSMCFTNTTIAGSTGSNCATTTAYSWNFGDPSSGASNTSSATNPCHTFSSVGSYTVSLTSSNPCGPSVFTKTICVRNPPTAKFTINKHEGCAPDTAIFTNTSPVDTCLGETYNWQVDYTDTQNCGTSNGASFVSNTSASSRDPRIRFSTPGRYIIILTQSAVASSCPSATFRDTFYVKAKPKIIFSSFSTTVCLGNPVNPAATVSNCYSGQVPVYHWTFPNGVPASSDSLNPGPVMYSDTGKYTITFTAENECGISTATTRDTIISIPQPNAGPAIALCSGQYDSIGIRTGNYVYSWNPITGLSNPNSARTRVTRTYTGPNADTTFKYYLTASAGSNCSGKDSVLVTVKKNPVVTVAPVSTVSCNGSGVILIATGANTYSWNPAVIPNNMGDTVTANPAGTAQTIYTVTGTRNGCTATAQATVTPRRVKADSSLMCNTSTAVQMTATPTGGTWSGHPALTSAGVFNPSAAGIGSHTIIYTYQGCLDSAKAIVTSGDSAKAGNDSAICQHTGTIQLNGNPAGGIWSGSGQVTATGVFNTNTPGTYVLIYRIGSGSCVSRDTVVLTVNSGIANNLISASQGFCYGGQPATLIGQAITGGGGGTPGYQWQSRDSASTVWNSIPSPQGTGQNYTPPVVITTVFYRRIAATALCSGLQKDTSTAVKITLYPDAKAQFIPTRTVACNPFIINADTLNLVPYNTANSQYQWFVNGSLYSTNPTFPAYTMNAPGDSITIKLVAISRYGCKNDSMQLGFKTIPRPVPAFTQSDSVGCGPVTVTFTNGTPNAAQYSYLWIFGTGPNSTLQQPGPVTFPPNPQSGDTVYTVRFITISQCSRDTLLRYVRVKSKPKALFTPDRSTGCSSYNFTFTNTSRGNGNSYVWDFGDGSPTLATNATTVQHIYHTGITDTFRVKLKATNECGTDSLVYKLVVQPITIRPDFAINGNERYGCLPHTVRFFNNSQGGSNFMWDFGDGSPLLYTVKNVDTITHTFSQTGTFTIRLWATNTCSDTTDTELVTVYPKPAVAFTAAPLVACFGDTIRMTNTSDTGLVYNWRFGDGGASQLRNPPHVYASGGSYRIWLKGIKAYPSGTGCADSAYQDVLIRDTLAGLFTASDTVLGCIPAAITFKNSNRPAALTTWTFGDGGTATGDSVTHTYSQPGIYVVKMISKGLAGCTYTFSKTITITSPAGTLQYTNGYLCPGTPLRMQVTANAATQQIRYVFGNGDSLTTTNPVVYYTYPQPGVYVPYAYVISGSCMARLTRGDTVRVDALRTGFLTQQLQICGATIVTFTDTSFAYFGIQSRRYDFGDGTFSTQQNPVKTYLQSGTYNVRLYITGISGCADTVTIPVVVSVRNKPVSTISGDSVACIGQSIALTALVQSADAVASYNWDFGNGVTGTGVTTMATYNQPGTFTVRLISRTGFGCADTVYKTIRVSPAPIVNAGPDVRICRGDSIRLGAIGANTWQWSPLQNLSCTTCPNPVAYPLFTTSYVVTGSNNALCRASDTIIVEVVQPFNMTVSPTTTLCIGDSVQLFATGAYTYAWNPPVSLDNPALSNPVAKPTITTVYQVVGRDRYNCFTDTDYVRVNVGRYPTVDLGTGGIVTAGTVINLNPVITNGPIVRYRWTPVTDLSCINCPRPTAVINKDIIYKLEVENNFGCTGSDTIIYKVNCDPNQLFIPNAFSPDGDGTNDVLMVRGRGIATLKYFRIFNRWGQLVFERSNINPNDPQQGWNGTINGTMAQPDVYIYTAEAVCTAGSTFVYKGNVTLVR